LYNLTTKPCLEVKHEMSCIEKYAQIKSKTTDAEQT